MRLDHDDALRRLTAHDHAVLCTVHPERGVDAVPVVYAVDHALVGIPVDRVKPKTASRLQRERNLEADPRATLLAEQWHRDDWTRLWWVRAELEWVAAPDPRHLECLADLLAARYVQYRDHPFDRLLVLRIVDVTGWSGDR